MSEYRAGAYLRLSQDDSREGESMSIENQRSFLTDYITEHGWELADIYADDGYTGLNFNRPGFQRMIDDVKSGRINLVIVKDLSRFGRNFIEMGQFTDYLFPSLGCRFIAVNDNVDSAEEENDFMPLKNWFNENYSKEISQRVRTARKARAESGHNMCIYAPYGYIRTKDAPPPQDESKPYIIDETAAPNVRRIYEMRCNGAGYRSIATALNDDGIETPRDHWYSARGGSNPKSVSHKWTDVTVKQILSNEAYIGNLVQQKRGSASYKNKHQVSKPPEDWIRVEHTHEPIVSQEEWQRVQQMAADTKARYTPKKPSEPSLFAGLLECADCHQTLVFSRDNNVYADGHRLNHHAYICSTNRSGGKAACSRHRTQERDLVAIVLSAIRNQAQRIRLDEKKVVADLRRSMANIDDGEKAAERKELRAARSRIAELEQLMQKLYEEMALGDLPRETMLSMMAKYREEQDKLKMRASELAETEAHSQEVEKDIREWVSLMKRYMDVTEVDRDLLTSVIEKIIVGEKTVTDGRPHQDITIIYKFVGQIE